MWRGGVLGGGVGVVDGDFFGELVDEAFVGAGAEVRGRGGFLGTVCEFFITLLKLG